MQEVAPAQVLEQEQPTEIRVTRTDGTELVLENPYVYRDTLSGLRGGILLSINVANVEAVAVRKLDVGMSILAGLLVIPVSLVGFIFVSYACNADSGGQAC